MALRAPAIRHLLSPHSSIAPLKHVQRRWAQVHDVRFVATHQPNHVLDRYKDKLDQKAKQEGHSSIPSLKEAYQDKIQAVRAAEAPEAQIPEATPAVPISRPSSTNSTSTVSSGAPKSSPPSSTSKSQTPGIKPLSSYLDIPKILTLPQKEIETLWRLRHTSNPNSVCATIPLDTYNRIMNTARQNPLFILPLPREIDVPSENKTSEIDASKKSTAAEMHILQWGFHPPSSTPTIIPTSPDFRTQNTHTSTVIFTHLASYKLHGTYSEPHTIITHHLDLADEKGLVLMNGTVVPNKGVSVDEAKLLIMWLQRFYDWGVDSNGGRKGEMLRMFSQGDTQGFKIEELIEEVQRV